MSGDLSPHFWASEFACNCGKCEYSTDPQMNPRLIDALEELRDEFGKPVTVNSGRRCAAHNKAVGGAPGSQHLLGNAADIRISGVRPGDVATAARTVDAIRGIGWYKTFTHVDVRDAARVEWDYR